MPERSGAYWFEMVDREKPPATGALRPDPRRRSPPTVSIDEIAARRRRHPGATVPVRVTARDDLAIDRIAGVEPLRPDRQGRRRGALRRSGPRPATARRAGRRGGVGRPTGRGLCMNLQPLGLQPGTQLGVPGRRRRLSAADRQEPAAAADRRHPRRDERSARRPAVARPRGTGPGVDAAAGAATSGSVRRFTPGQTPARTVQRRQPRQRQAGPAASPRPADQ